MQKIQIEFLSSGFHDLLMSDEVSGVVEEAAANVAAVAVARARSTKTGRHAEYVVKGPKAGGYGGGRMIAYVATGNAAAYLDNVENHTLESAIWAVKS